MDRPHLVSVNQNPMCTYRVRFTNPNKGATKPDGTIEPPNVVPLVFRLDTSCEPKGHLWWRDCDRPTVRLHVIERETITVPRTPVDTVYRFDAELKSVQRHPDSHCVFAWVNWQIYNSALPVYKAGGGLTGPFGLGGAGTAGPIPDAEKWIRIMVCCVALADRQKYAPPPAEGDKDDAGDSEPDECVHTCKLIDWEQDP